MSKARVAKKDGEALPLGFGGPNADIYTRSLVNFKEAVAEIEALPPGMPIPRGLMTRLESPAYKILVEEVGHSNTA